MWLVKPKLSRAIYSRRSRYYLFSHFYLTYSNVYIFEGEPVFSGLLHAVYATGVDIVETLCES